MKPPKKVMTPDPILIEIDQLIRQVEGFGSVEIYVQNNVVTQITMRKIKKTNTKLSVHAHKRKQTLDKPISIY